MTQGVLRDGPADAVDATLQTIVTCTAADGSGSFIYGHGPEDFARAATDERLSNVRLGLPYRRFYQEKTGRWRYLCPLLGLDGRCKDYAHRPAPCRALTPGEAKPCCHYVKSIGACPERSVDYLLAEARS